MKLNKKSLKILLSISIVLLMVFSSFLYFRIKRIKWENVYENSTGEYMDEKFYPISEKKYVATLWLYEIKETDNTVELGVFPYGNDIKLVFDKEKVNTLEEIEIDDEMYDYLLQAFISIEVEEEKKNILSKISCVISNGEYCSKKVYISKVDIYKSEYPLPTLSEDEMSKFARYNIEKHENSSEILKNNEEMKCNNLLSTSLVKSGISLSQEDLELYCKDDSTVLLYANLFEDENSIYEYVSQRVCNKYSLYEEESLVKIFSPTSVRIFNSMCNTNFVVKEEEYKEKKLYGVSGNILFLLNNQESKEYSNRIEKVKNLLINNFFTTSSSPNCIHMYACDIELINLSMYIFNE